MFSVTLHLISFTFGISAKFNGFFFFFYKIALILSLIYSPSNKCRIPQCSINRTPVENNNDFRLVFIPDNTHTISTYTCEEVTPLKNTLAFKAREYDINLVWNSERSYRVFSPTNLPHPTHAISPFSIG